MQKTYAVVPTHGSAQLRIFNTLNCSVPMTVQKERIEIKALDYWENKEIKAEGSIELNFTANFASCHKDDYSIESGDTKGIYLNFWCFSRF